MKNYQGFDAVYIHIPFCKQKCLYCDFPSYSGFSCETMKNYESAIVEEIRLRAFDAEKTNSAATIFFGGGTPSILPIESLHNIVVALKQYGFWKSPREASIEVNPGTVDLAKLKALRSLGFDRISFGVQSLNNEELKAIGRIHTAKEATDAILMAKEAGFKRINADIMYGLPGQTLESLACSMQMIVDTGIEHISAYSLILEEDTPLEKLVDSHKIVLPDEDYASDMYDLVQKFLADHGYKRYEVSNYARDGKESEHNKVYWSYHPYLGFGAAACSFLGDVRITATSDVKNYISMMDELKNKQKMDNYQKDKSDNIFSAYNNIEEIYNIEQLSKDEIIAEYMFMGLRTLRGANLTEAKERFGIDVLEEFSQNLASFFENSLLVHDDNTNYLRLTERGMAIGNIIFEAFIK